MILRSLQYVAQFHQAVDTTLLHSAKLANITACKLPALEIQVGSLDSLYSTYTYMCLNF